MIQVDYYIARLPSQAFWMEEYSHAFEHVTGERLDRCDPEEADRMVEESEAELTVMGWSV